MTFLTASIAGGLAAALAGVATAGAPAFHHLGAGVTPYGVSADGSLVAGIGAEYFIWTADTGLVLIGGTPPGGGAGGAAKVSDDGGRVSGTALNAASGLLEASYYDVAAGEWVHLGGIGGVSGSETSSGWAVSGDGLSVVGLGWVNAGSAHAIQWKEGDEQVTDMGSTVPGRSTRANQANYDGSVVVGWQDAVDGFRQGAVWVEGVQTLLFAPGTGDPLSEASDVSADGTWVVGSGGFATSGQAWRWSAETGAEALGSIFSSTWNGAATAVSADGGVIVGFYRPFGPPLFGQGFIWTEATGMMNLTTYAAEQGVPLPEGAVLSLPLDISADGRTIVGAGLIGFSPIGFAITLPGEGGECEGDLDGSGGVDGADLGALLAEWGAADSDADLNGDGVVDGADLGALLAAWGGC